LLPRGRNGLPWAGGVGLADQDASGLPSVPQDGTPEKEPVNESAAPHAPQADASGPGGAAGSPVVQESAEAATPGPATPGAGDEETREPGSGEPVAAAPSQTREARADDRPTLIVRYGAMALLGRFTHSLETWRCNQTVVIKSDRGQEVGTVLCKWEGCGAPEGVPTEVKGEIIRAATHSDILEERHLLDDQQRELDFCRQRIAERNLPMKLVVAEHLFGGDRIVFYFLAETRVDFRSLVRDLAQEYRTRIEMRQIGVRDEARLLGDYERCGRPLCCRAWIKELQPVSMKMAKLQKATLDPAKISGRCGRLMCCLRFEDATYREMVKNLPRRNTFVRTTEGVGKVIDGDVVTQVVAVQLAGGKRVNVPVEAVLERDVTLSASDEAAQAGIKPSGRESAGAARDRRAQDRAQRPRDRAASQPPAGQPPAGQPPASQPPAQEGQPPQDDAGREGRSGRRRRRRRRPRRGRDREPGAPSPGGQAQGSQPSNPEGGSPAQPGSGPGDSRPPAAG